MTYKSSSFTSCSARTLKSESVFSIVNKSWQRFVSLSFVLRCLNSFRQRQTTTNIMCDSFTWWNFTLRKENRQGGFRSTQPTNRNLYSSWFIETLLLISAVFTYFRLNLFYVLKNLSTLNTFKTWRYYMSSMHVFTLKCGSPIFVFYWLYKTRVGGRSYSSTTDNLLDFYTN